MSEKKVIKFYGYKNPFSNFYRCPVRIGSFIYPTNEHWYQSEKCKDWYDKLDIIMADTPKEAKKLGRYFEMREDWDERKLVCMYKGLKAKFTQHRDLKKMLLDTEDAQLIEDSPFDNYWGRGKNYKGQNKMGKLLMKLREELHNEA